MKTVQEFTPKYWVVHDPNSDDVFIDTASKSALDAENKFTANHGAHYSDLGYRLDLIQIDWAMANSGKG